MAEPPAGFVDVTTEQPAIPAGPPQQLAPPPGAAEPTQVQPAIRPGAGFPDDGADQYGADQYDDFAYPQDWDENEWEGDSGLAGDNIDDRDPLAAPSFEGEETPADRTRAIDATLARFSAVHDQIKEEEEERRKRYAWILGKKKEPELGTDMPFDTEERDSGASRVEWKQQQKKKRTARMVQVIAGLVILVAVVTMALVAM